MNGGEDAWIVDGNETRPAFDNSCKLKPCMVEGCALPENSLRYKVELTLD